MNNFFLEYKYILIIIIIIIIIILLFYTSEEFQSSSSSPSILSTIMLNSPSSSSPVAIMQPRVSSSPQPPVSSLPPIQYMIRLNTNIALPVTISECKILLEYDETHIKWLNNANNLSIRDPVIVIINQYLDKNKTRPISIYEITHNAAYNNLSCFNDINICYEILKYNSTNINWLAHQNESLSDPTTNLISQYLTFVKLK